MLTVGQEGSPLIEINSGRDLWAMAFAANGKYLVSGGNGVRVWRVEDGKQMATMEAEHVRCFAVSADGRWIAAGTNWGHVIVWDAKTYEKVFSRREAYNEINGVDFSPDSCRLVSAWRRASIWDIAARKQVQTLDHGYYVTAARYSPQGDRIATATGESVRVWDSNDGRLLVDIKVTVTPLFNSGLLWSNNYLFVISDSKIKQFEASTGSTVSEWRVPDSNWRSCIALPKHAGFLTCSTQRTVTFWNMATHTQLGLIQHFEEIFSIAVSPDDRFLAIAGDSGKINIRSLSYVTVSILSCWLVVHTNNFLTPIILPCDSTPLSHTPHIPGTGHSHRRHCAPFWAAQSTRKRASITRVG
jgi:WD40 repeat protein